MPEIPNITIVRSDRRTIALQVAPDATLLVKAPRRMPERMIHAFIEEQRDWIDKHVTLVKKRAKQIKEDGEYLFLGKSVTFTPSNVLEIAIKDDKLLFPQALLFRKEKELTNWYMRQARNIITQQVERYAREMKTSYTDLTFSDTRSQWGRCTHDNRFQFSWRLVMAPLLVLNYVVIHELAHTMEKNHTHRFWAKVRGFNPSYRQQIKWLNNHGASLKVS